MSVVKQKFVTLSGSQELMESTISFLSREKDFIIDDPPENLKTMHRAVQSGEVNPYVSLSSRLVSLAESAKETTDLTSENYSDTHVVELKRIEDFDVFIEKNYARFYELSELCTSLKTEISENEKILEQLMHLKNIDAELHNFFEFKSIKVRFGYLPASNYDRLRIYIGNMKSVIFLPSSIESDYVWGMYFSLEDKVSEVDSLLSSLNFSRIHIPDRVSGIPTESLKALATQTEEKKVEFNEAKANLSSFAKALTIALDSCKDELSARSIMFETKRKTILAKDGFTLYGWIPEKKLSKFEKEFGEIGSINVISQSPNDVSNKPPIVLNNIKFIRPFQNYVEMYGSPAYNEIDPTPLVALTYSLFFGMMFGDVGQGAVLIMGGLLFQKIKKMWLGGIIAVCGCMSVVFGFIYGSVFGNEEILTAVFKPNDNINTILLFAVSIGVVMIVICGILNVINGIRQKDVGKYLFSPNGLVGLVFYISAVIFTLCAFNFIQINLPSSIFVAVLAICLILLFLRKPIIGFLEKKKDFIPHKFGEFFAENFFELFEVVLSFITNTISFIRIGAFALSHAGMMTVVYLLAQTAKGSHNILILIIGNIVVIGLEGLIVGIQILRLEFYELFSRFYDGTGRKVETKK